MKVDTTAPSAPTGIAFSALTNAYYPGAGTTIYFRGGTAGGFTATASGSTDADTGVFGYNYGAVAGTGWANAAGAYTFTAASPTGTGALTATNNAGLTGSSTTFTAQSDTTAPSGGAFSANGTAATGGGSSSYLTAGTTLSINSRTDYTDSGSGIASSTLTIQSASLAGNSCSSFGAPSTISGTTSPDRRERQLLPADADGHGQRGHHAASISDDGEGGHDARRARRPGLRLLRADERVSTPGAGSTVYSKGGADRRLHGRRARIDRRRVRRRVVHLRRHRRNRLGEHG